MAQRAQRLAGPPPASGPPCIWVPGRGGTACLGLHSSEHTRVPQRLPPGLTGHVYFPREDASSLRAGTAWYSSLQSKSLGHSRHVDHNAEGREGEREGWPSGGPNPHPHTPHSSQKMQLIRQLTHQAQAVDGRSLSFLLPSRSPDCIHLSPCPDHLTSPLGPGLPLPVRRKRR